MATLLKPRAEKPARIFFYCPQQMAARLKNLEDIAAQRGVDVDIDTPLTAALDRLIIKAERELMPVAQAVSIPQQDATQVFQPMP